MKLEVTKKKKKVWLVFLVGIIKLINYPKLSYLSRKSG